MIDDFLFYFRIYSNLFRTAQTESDYQCDEIQSDASLWLSGKFPTWLLNLYAFQPSFFAYTRFLFIFSCPVVSSVFLFSAEIIYCDCLYITPTQIAKNLRRIWFPKENTVSIRYTRTIIMGLLLQTRIFYVTIEIWFGSRIAKNYFPDVSSSSSLIKILCYKLKEMGLLWAGKGSFGNPHNTKASVTTT